MLCLGGSAGMRREMLQEEVCLLQRLLLQEQRDKLALQQENLMMMQELHAERAKVAVLEQEIALAAQAAQEMGDTVQQFFCKQQQQQQLSQGGAGSSSMSATDTRMSHDQLLLSGAPRQQHGEVSSALMQHPQHPLPFTVTSPDALQLLDQQQQQPDGSEGAPQQHQPTEDLLHVAMNLKGFAESCFERLMAGQQQQGQQERPAGAATTRPPSAAAAFPGAAQGPEDLAQPGLLPGDLQAQALRVSQMALQLGRRVSGGGSRSNGSQHATPVMPPLRASSSTGSRGFLPGGGRLSRGGSLDLGSSSSSWHPGARSSRCGQLLATLGQQQQQPNISSDGSTSAQRCAVTRSAAAIAGSCASIAAAAAATAAAAAARKAAAAQAMADACQQAQQAQPPHGRYAGAADWRAGSANIRERQQWQAIQEQWELEQQAARSAQAQQQQQQQDEDEEDGAPLPAMASPPPSPAPASAAAHAAAVAVDADGSPDSDAPNLGSPTHKPAGRGPPGGASPLPRFAEGGGAHDDDDLACADDTTQAGGGVPHAGWQQQQHEHEQCVLAREDSGPPFAMMQLALHDGQQQHHEPQQLVMHPAACGTKAWSAPPAAPASGLDSVGPLRRNLPKLTSNSNVFRF